MKNLLQNSIVIILLLWSYTTCAQSVSYRTLTTKDGLPSNTVYQVKQDAKGFIWMATANGLVRYDGKKFKLYNPENIKDKDIIGFIIDNNQIWFWNFTGELYRIRDNQIKKISFKKSLDIKIKDFVKFSNQYYVLTVNKQLFLLTQSLEYKLLKTFQTGQPNHFIQDDKRLFLKRKDSIFEILNDSVKFSFQFYSPIFGGGLLEGRLFFYRYNNESWCLREFQDKLYKVDDKGELKKNSNILKFIKGDLERLYQDKFKQFWCITSDEIIVVDSSEQQLIHRINFKYRDKINNFFQDSEYNYWLPLSKKGVAIIASTQINIQQQFTGLKDEEIIVNKLYHTNTDDLLISVNDGNIIHKDLKTKKDKVLTIDNKRTIYTIEKGFEDEIWIVSRETATVLNSNLKDIKYHNVGEIYIVYKSIFFDDETNDLFIGNYNGVIKIPSTKYNAFVTGQTKYNWVTIRKAFAIKDVNYRVYSIIKVGDHYWLGTTNGLYEYDGEEARLTNISQLQNSWITKIIKQDNSVWVGTQTDGLFKIRNKKIVAHYNKKNGLISNNCKQLVIEPNGVVWIGTNKGINKINAVTGEIELINNLDGLPNNDITALASDNQKIYVGTSEGLISFDKNIQTKNKVAPPIHCSSFQIFEKDTILSEKYVLKHYQNNIRIGFTGISFRSQGTIKYKYRMKGLSNDWSTTTSDYVSYPVLNSGNYTFEAVAINEDGIESKTPILITIIIQKSFWTTWWFRGISIIIIVILIWLFFRARIERLNVQNEFQQKINKLEMQALQAQMNPHFIFNVLSSIQHYLIINDGEQAMIYLSKFAKLIRMIFDFSRKSTISLYEEVNFLNLYMEMEKLRFKQKIQVNLTIDDDILEEDVQLPPLLIQPIVENCFKHGLLHKEGEGKVDINFKLENNSITCVVKDNGIGREATVELKKWKKKTHKSAGVHTTKERLELWLSQQTENVPNDFFKISDLKNEKGEAQGTSIKLLLIHQVQY
ncbi:MAG: histidine kinase [Saprospiraceae bacterium]